MTTLALRIHIPVHTVSETNQRGHWRKHYNRHRDQRRAGYWAAMKAMREDLGNAHTALSPRVLFVTRIAPRPLDGGNLAASMKHVQDGVCDALGINDGDRSIHWHYEQERGRPKEYAVRVEVHEHRRRL